VSRTIFFHGLRRSGNHAVINWILTGLPGTFHVNDAFPIGRELRQPGTYAFPYRYDSFLISKLGYRRLARVLMGARLLISFEDFPIDQRFFRNPPKARQVLVVRSARNVFASRIRSAFGEPKSPYARAFDERMRREMDVWIDHASALRDRRDSPDFVGVAFDRWVSDAAYRARLAGRLGFEDRHGVSAERQRHGGGSSFEGNASVAQADRERLTRRDEQLTQEERVLLDAVLADRELAAEAERFDLHLSEALA
jgi:hypothetical protein